MFIVRLHSDDRQLMTGSPSINGMSCKGVKREIKRVQCERSYSYCAGA